MTVLNIEDFIISLNGSTQVPIFSKNGFIGRYEKHVIHNQDKTGVGVTPSSSVLVVQNSIQLLSKQVYVKSLFIQFVFSMMRSSSCAMVHNT